MFQHWDFLITEMVTLIVLAAFFGLLAGWLIFGGRRGATETGVQAAEREKLQADLGVSERARAALQKRVSSLQQELEAARAAPAAPRPHAPVSPAPVPAPALDTAVEGFSIPVDTFSWDQPSPPPSSSPPPAPEVSAMPARSGGASPHAALVQPSAALAGEQDLATRKAVWRYERPTEAVPPPAEPAAPAAPEDADRDFDGDGVVEGREEGQKPRVLTAARDGLPDDLKQIRGIGIKLEALCHRLGIYHFDQIAAWSDQEVAWVDANLDGFKGRVSRDGWVEQARRLVGTGAYSGTAP